MAGRWTAADMPDLSGRLAVVTGAPKAYDEEAWQRLWKVSEELTGVRYEFVAAQPA